MAEELSNKSKRGFASMSPEKRREIGSLGGRSVLAEKRHFAANRDLTAKAGSIGGKSVAAENRTFFKNRALAQELGRKGGVARSEKSGEAK